MVGSRADSAFELVLGIPVAAVAVAVVEVVVVVVVVVVEVENDGVVGELPRWCIAVVEEDGRWKMV